MVAGDKLKFVVPGCGEVSALLVRPADARWLLVLGHGAGAGMTHPFLEKLARELASVGVAAFRYQFPYMEYRRREPDAPPVQTQRGACAERADVKAAVGRQCRDGVK